MDPDLITKPVTQGEAMDERDSDDCLTELFGTRCVIRIVRKRERERDKEKERERERNKEREKEREK